MMILYAGTMGKKKTVKTLIGYKSSHVSRLMEENLETASALIGWLKGS